MLNFGPQVQIPHYVLGHIYIYADGHKVNPDIFHYFISFYSCITSISLFTHYFYFFSENFPIFVATPFTSKACHSDMALLILLPFGHPLSHASCGIKLYNMKISISEVGARTLHNHLPCHLLCVCLGINFPVCCVGSKQGPAMRSLAGYMWGQNIHLHFSPQWIDHHWGV